MKLQKLIGASALTLAFALTACGDDQKKADAATDQDAQGTVEETAKGIEDGAGEVEKKVEDAFGQVDKAAGDVSVTPETDAEHHEMVADHADQFAKDHAEATAGEAQPESK